MTELYVCPDCAAEIAFDERREHLKAEHGVTYAIPESACGCGEQPCERAATAFNRGHDIASERARSRQAEGLPL